MLQLGRFETQIFFAFTPYRTKHGLNLVLIDIFSHHWDSESSVVCDVSEDTTYVGYESGNEQRESSLASSDFTNNEQLDGGNHTAAVQNRQGWKKRPRVGQIPDEQEETTMNPTTLEKALKSYAIWKNGLVVQPTVGTHFDSMAEAFEFYNLYSWQIGFGIRYDRSRWNSQRTKTIQDIVCGCAELSNVSNLRCRTLKSGGPSMITSIWTTRSRSSLFSWCAVRSS